MKNNGIKNLKVLGASLCLGAVLLTEGANNYKHVQYYDLRTGSCMIDRFDYYNQEKVVYAIGESLNMLEEKSITPYFITENFIKKRYTVEELLKFFEEKVLPTLNSSNKELLK